MCESTNIYTDSCVWVTIWIRSDKNNIVRKSFFSNLTLLLKVVSLETCYFLASEYINTDETVIGVLCAKHVQFKHIWGQLGMFLGCYEMIVQSTFPNILLCTTIQKNMRFLQIQQMVKLDGKAQMNCGVSA